MATAWQQFLRITLPMVKPTLVVAVLFRTLDTLRMFDLPYGMIGPGKYRVETLSLLLPGGDPDPVRSGGGVCRRALHLRAVGGLPVREDPGRRRHW